MYSRKVQHSILGKHNLHSMLETKIKKRYLFQYTIMMRKITVVDTLNSLRNMSDKIKIAIQKKNILETLRMGVSSIPHNLKQQSSKILRVWTHQCECVIAQRLRRSQQMFSLYTKLWEERALREFFIRMRQQLVRHGKEVVCSAVYVGCYDWGKHRIPAEEILVHSKEFEYITKLRQNTIKCSQCDSVPLTEKKICHCPDKTKFKYDEWELFIEKDDLLIWRKRHDNGCYEYKVYGSYNDVTAEDFVNVQIDIDYRKTWDPAAIVLELIENDPTPKSNSDLVYWEMQWPRLFANRDYVFNRRFLVDHASKTILIANRITEHQHIPPKPDKFRVKDYWSNMVIKPYTEYNKPGIEFALTYFENSGVNVPSTVTSWVAMKAMPEYLTKLREATKEYASYCKTKGHTCICRFLYEDCDKKIQVVRQTEDQPPKNPPLLITHKETKFSPPDIKPQKSTEKAPGPTSDLMVPVPTNQSEYKSSYWKYLKPMYYFS